ncbi:MAG: response regulator, partial [Planctomycetes bacterium]|nr:response regulator [Planctomycetota bacterium]
MNVESMGTRPEVLLIEDNPSDARLTLEAFKLTEHAANLTVAKDALEALAILRRQGKHLAAHQPDLILLDLNLPKKDGRDFLAEVKGDPFLRCIPVIVLTGSNSKHDVLKSYDLHANCYVVKPVDLDEFAA